MIPVGMGYEGAVRMPDIIVRIEDKLGVIGFDDYPFVPAYLDHHDAPPTNRYRYRIKR